MENQKTGIHQNIRRTLKNLQIQIRQHLLKPPEAVLGKLTSPHARLLLKETWGEVSGYLEGISSI
jgi:hypothetical protein